MLFRQGQVHLICSRSLAFSFIKQLILLICMIPVGVTAKPIGNIGTETVTLQLKYYHQFQFAGYYAALEKGFYKEAGLDVKLKANEPDLKSPIDKVLSGTAQYGVADNTLVIERLAGKPVVVLANMFQKSPAVWIVREDSGIRGPHDLVGKRVMRTSGLNSQKLAMLQVEGIPVSKINWIPASFNVQDLIDGHTDAYNGYTTNEPYTLREQGIAYRFINPRNYGIDFYGDVLFTSEAEIKQHPERAKAFRLASLKGWQYAMDNPDEIINLISSKYASKKSLPHLKFEAEAMRDLILPDLVRIGHINPGRWRSIAETLVTLDMAEANYDLLEGFIYDPFPKPHDLTKHYAVIASAVLLALLFLGLVIRIGRLNTRLQKSERGLNDAQHIAHLGSWEWGITNNIISWSDELCRIYGLEPGEIEPSFEYFISLLSEGTKVIVTDAVDKALAGKAEYDIEFPITLENGTERIVRAQGIVKRDQDGKPLRMLGTTHDITERKKIKDTIKESELRLNEAQEIAHLASWEVGLSDGTVKWSDEQYRMYGLEPGQIVPSYDYYFNAVHKDDRDANQEALDKALSGEADYHNECRLIKEDGEEIIVISKGLVERANDGTPVRIYGTTQDITERKLAEKALRKSEKDLQAIFDNMQDAFYRADINGRLTMLSPSAEILMQYTLEELMGKSLADFYVDPDGRKKFLKALEEEGGNVKGYEAAVRIKDGSQIWVSTNAHYFLDDEGNINGVEGTIRDITARKNAEENLKNSERGLSEAQRIAHLGSWKWDIITNDLNWTDQIFRIFGLEPQEFIPTYPAFLERIHSDDRQSVTDAVENAVSNNQPYDIEHRIVRPDSEVRYVLEIGEVQYDKNNKPISMIGSVQDITERKQSENEKEDLQLELQQSQKMEALGKLTGGIAHEYNNMLAIMIGFSELLKVSLKEQPKLLKYAAEIQHAGNRAAKLTSKLLTFSRQKKPEAASINLNELLKKQQHMLEKTLTVRINLVFKLQEDLWPVWLDDGDMEDVIINMSINAMHAIADSGQLTIQTHNQNLNQMDAQSLVIPAGDYVLLSFTDTGCGIDEKIKEKIFDPFFTTKGMDGTGLGLSMVYGFVKNSGGNIKVFSELNHGSQFTLYFPRYHGASDVQEAEKENNSEENFIGNKTILVVDDEAALLELTSEILSEHGFKVICAESAKAALNILEKESIEILISDIIMPELDGYQLAAIVKDEYPEVKIQLASGFSDERSKRGVDQHLQQNMLHKPFNSQALLQRIRELSDEN